jgi:hypothetical protein
VPKENKFDIYLNKIEKIEIFRRIEEEEEKIHAKTTVFLGKLVVAQLL